MNSPLPASVLPPTPPREFLATPHGLELLEQEESVVRRAFLEFCATDYEPQAFLKSFAGSEAGHTGDNYEACRTGYLAIKVAAPELGKQSWKYGRTRNPENLTRQFAFLDVLRQHLDASGDTSISVAEQYLAARNHRGDYLHIEDHHANWKSIREFCRDSGLSKAQRQELLGTLEDRVAKTITSPSLHLQHSESLAVMRSIRRATLLVPEGTKNPETAPLRIVDPQTNGFLGNVATKLLAKPRNHELAT